MLIILFMWSFVNAAQAGGGQGAGAKGQPGQMKQFTGDLCEGDASNAVRPTTGTPTPKGNEFIPACASCILSAMQKGENCRAGSWTLKSRCECTNTDFLECTCKRRPSPFSYIVFLALPGICILLILVSRRCISKKGCPLFKWESEFQQWLKAQEIEIDKERKEKGLPSLAEEAKELKEKEKKEKKKKKKKKHKKRRSSDSSDEESDEESDESEESSVSESDSDDSTRTRRRKRKKKKKKGKKHKKKFWKFW